MIQYKGKPKIHTIVLHNTAVSRKQQPKQLAGVNRHHRYKDWGGGWKQPAPSELGWWVGYNFFCEPSGERVQTRLVGEETIAQVGNNCDVPSRCGMVSYCMAGFFHVEKPTALQVADFVQFCNEIGKTYPDAKVKQHKDVAANRTCAELTAEEVERWFEEPADDVDSLRRQVERLKKQNLQLIGMVKTLIKIIQK